MLKYGPGIKHQVSKNINYKNKGLSFENEINISNNYYLSNKIAFIYKKPTPIKIVKAIKSNNTYKIIEAYFMMPSTTDYNGLYKGKYIDFEAKETTSLTSFPYGNIHQNQIDHLINIVDNGGIAFLLIRFIKLNEVYLYEASKLKEDINNNLKSIKIEKIKKEGYLVPSLYTCPINYLKIVDKLFFEV